MARRKRTIENITSQFQRAMGSLIEGPKIGVSYYMENLKNAYRKKGNVEPNVSSLAREHFWRRRNQLAKAALNAVEKLDAQRRNQNNVKAQGLSVG